MAHRRRSILRTGELPKGRVESFSDGVFAFVATLLALELTVPALTGPDLGAKLRHEYFLLWPKFLSYVLGFAFVAVWWVNHHQFFHHLKRTDRGIIWLNNLFLMFLIVLPFPIAVMGDYPHEPLAVMPFGLASIVCAIINTTMRWYAGSAGLWSEEVTPQRQRRAIRRSLIGPVLYAIAVATVGIDVRIAWAVYIIVPVYYFLPAGTDAEDAAHPDAS